MNKSKITTRVAVCLIVAAVWSFMPGSYAAAQSLNYTGLGDSIAFGLFAPVGRGYVPLYSGALRANFARPVNTFPLGIPGWTSTDLLDGLRSNIWLRLFVFSSDVVTWNIGGNDLSRARNQYKAGTCGGVDNQDCMVAAVERFVRNWDGIVAEIRRLRRGRPTILRTMDIYNPFVTEDRGSDSWPDVGTDFDVLNRYLGQVNAYIAQSSAVNGVGVAGVHVYFNGASGAEDPWDKGLLAFDRFHPSGAGHAAMASLLAGVGFLPSVP